MSPNHCPMCQAPLPERLNDPAEPKPCEHAKGEWWDRAVWCCIPCSFFLRVGGMYDYGGDCPRCKGVMVVSYIREDIPF
jgi:hypothetical protein